MEYELPNNLRVWFSFDFIEEPDPASGIFGSYVNDFWISEVGGRKCSQRVASWLMNRYDFDAEYISDKILETYA